jgi:hypothetical protein
VKSQDVRHEFPGPGKGIPAAKQRIGSTDIVASNYIVLGARVLGAKLKNRNKPIPINFQGLFLFTPARHRHGWIVIGTPFQGLAEWGRVTQGVALG